MFLSRMSRFINIFYFNSHRVKFSSLFINPTLIRRLEFSFKIILSFIISGLIAYKSPLIHHSDQQYLVCVMSILAIQETFGATLYSAIQIVISLVPLSVLLFIIQIIGLSYKHYLATELLLLISSLIIAYHFTQIQTRKITLLFNAIFFSTIVNQNGLPKYFVFLLLELFLIGIIIALFISLLIFPLFATIDIENRFNYCLKNFQRMYYFIIQAFLSRDKMNAKVSLSRASIIEQIIHQTMFTIQIRMMEANYEPSKLLKYIFYRKRKHIINLSVQEQENLLNSLMFHVCSLQLMVNQCQYSDYHNNLRDGLESSIYYLNSCQTSLISSFISFESITQDEFNYRLLNFSKSIESVRLSYKNVRLYQVENSLQSTKIIQSEDHLSHAFFLFQLFSIVKLLTGITIDNKNTNISKTKEYKNFFNQCFIFQWSRFLLAIKSTIIIGVGSIFVMVPYLAKIFENGQWILIALCMTQADTVGGAFTTMKMRLIGTLLGAMWSYITYLLVHDNIFETFIVLIPWLFLFSYLRLFPEWGYTAVVASFTPILISLGRIPFGDALPAGNYALLRIEENLVGILIAIFLAMCIFPVFAIDLLKENIQKSLELCAESVDTMHSVYDELFHHEHLDKTNSIHFDNKNEIKSFLDKQRLQFQQFISSQRALVSNASIEPSFFWFKNDFSSIRYNLIVQQQIDVFRMLRNIDVALIHLSECSIKNEQELEFIKIQAAEGLFLPNLHNELFDLSQQLNVSLKIWSSFFKSTQTRCYQITRGLIPHRTELIQTDLLKHEQCLIDLNKTIYKLQNEHQQGINRLFDHYFQRFSQGEKPTTFVPYAQNEQADFILLSLSAMYYSITQLAHIALNLGTTILEVFELETTDLYQSF